nr:MAG TPA: voltage-gated potassium channel protein [Caudoviricetes sp.]
MDEIDYINAYKGYRKWQKLVYGMIPCRAGRALAAMVTIAGVIILASIITLITSPIVIIKTAIKKINEDGPQEIIMAIEFKRIKNGYEQYIKDIGGIQ